MTLMVDRWADADTDPEREYPPPSMRGAVARQFSESLGMVANSPNVRVYEDRRTSSVLSYHRSTYLSAVGADQGIDLLNSFDVVVKVLKRHVDSMAVAQSTPSGRMPALRAYVDKAQELERAGKLSEAIDIIYREVDDRLSAGANGFDECDGLLASLDPETLTTHAIIGLLSATFRASPRLKNRYRFFVAARREIKLRGIDPSRLIDGLRGKRAANEKGVPAGKKTGH